MPGGKSFCCNTLRRPCNELTRAHSSISAQLTRRRSARIVRFWPETVKNRTLFRTATLSLGGTRSHVGVGPGSDPGPTPRSAVVAILHSSASMFDVLVVGGGPAGLSAA